MRKPLGKHYILDIWGEKYSFPFMDMNGAASMLEKLAILAGATVLTQRWHHFGERFGFTGVIVLAESHISVHTWPEEGFAAIDIFMCGKADPVVLVDPVKNFFSSKECYVKIIDRGE
jgi:S-adenosylmethionine decarboxylase